MSQLTPIHQPRPVPVILPKDGFAHGAYPKLVGCVLHDTESHDEAGIGDIQGIINYWAQTPLSKDRLGAHFIVDSDGNHAQLADPKELLYHCGYNTGRCGIEQIGFSTFSTHIWRLRAKQLRKVAKLLAWLHHAYGMPLTIGVEEGVCTHAMVTAKYPQYTAGHTDPGRLYPFHYVLGMARYFVAQGGWTH